MSHDQSFVLHISISHISSLHFYLLFTSCLNCCKSPNWSLPPVLFHFSASFTDSLAWSPLKINSIISLFSLKIFIGLPLSTKQHLCLFTWEHKPLCNALLQKWWHKLFLTFLRRSVPPFFTLNPQWNVALWVSSSQPPGVAHFPAHSLRAQSFTSHVCSNPSTLCNGFSLFSCLFSLVETMDPWG